MVRSRSGKREAAIVVFGGEPNRCGAFSGAIFVAEELELAGGMNQFEKESRF